MPSRLLKWRLFALLLAAGLAMAVVVMLVMAKMHEELSAPLLERLDRSGLAFMHRHQTPARTMLARALSWIGSPVQLVPAISISAAVLWWRRMRRDALLLLIAVGGSGTLDVALKLHFRRIRPEVPWAFVHEHSFSFPSGHSVAAVVLYGILTYLLWTHLRDLRQRAAAIATALLLIGGIGASRIYLGVHYPTDVLAGYVVGLLWLLPVIGAAEYLARAEVWQRHQASSRDQPVSPRR
jgi:undecaprenyl-diphosphatase